MQLQLSDPTKWWSDNFILGKKEWVQRSPLLELTDPSKDIFRQRRRKGVWRRERHIPGADDEPHRHYPKSAPYGHCLVVWSFAINRNLIFNSLFKYLYLLRFVIKIQSICFVQSSTCINHQYIYNYSEDRCELSNFPKANQQRPRGACGKHTLARRAY